MWSRGGSPSPTSTHPWTQEPAGYRYERSDWCTNLDCPSNQLCGLRRTGVDDCQCLECDAVVRTPFPDVTAHRRKHTGQSDEPGSYSYT